MPKCRSLRKCPRAEAPRAEVRCGRAEVQKCGRAIAPTCWLRWLLSLTRTRTPALQHFGTSALSTSAPRHSAPRTSTRSVFVQPHPAIRGTVTDIVHALRALRAMPLLSAVVIVSLAIGIGANTVVFSWLQMVRWKPLPGVTAAATLQTIEPRTDGGVYIGASWPDYRDLHERLTSFQWLLAFRMAPLTHRDAARVERAYGLLVSGNYFASLDLRPPRAGLLTPDDATTPGRRPVIVHLTPTTGRRVSAAPSAIGASLRVNGDAHGRRRHAAAAFRARRSAWHSTCGCRRRWRRRHEGVARARGPLAARLRRDGPAAPRRAARRGAGQLDAAMRELAVLYPETNQSLRAEITPFTSPPRGPQRMLGAALCAAAVR